MSLCIVVGNNKSWAVWLVFIRVKSLLLIPPRNVERLTPLRAKGNSFRRPGLSAFQDIFLCNTMKSPKHIRKNLPFLIYLFVSINNCVNDIAVYKVIRPPIVYISNCLH